MPAASAASTKYGSPSSMTRQRSTREAKLAHQLQRQRIGQAQFEHAGVRRRFAHMLIGDSRGNDAQRTGAFHHLIGTVAIIPGRHLPQFFAQVVVRRTGESRDHHARANVVNKLRGPWLREGAGASHHGFGMTHSRGDSQQHRHPPALRDLDSAKRKVISLLRIRRLQHRYRCRDRIAAIVLFILAGGHAGVVGRDNYQSAADSRVSHGEQRICRHVQSDMFHGDYGACAGISHADADLKCHLLVGRPLCLSAQALEPFENLGRRCAGVSRTQLHASVKSGRSNRFITTQKQHCTLPTSRRSLPARLE